jgi:hypothetical protein
MGELLHNKNSRKNKKTWEDYLNDNNWTTYLAYELSKLKQNKSNKSKINTLNNYEALLTQCSYLSRMAYCPADIFCRMTEHLDILPYSFNDYLKSIEDIYDDLFKYKCSYDSKYIQTNPKFIEKFNPYNANSLSSSQQTAGGPTFNNSNIKKKPKIGYFIQNEKKLNAYIYFHHNKDSKFNKTPTLYISFKGSSNFNDFWHDLKSAVSKNISLSELNQNNPVIQENDGKASSIFIDILKESITELYDKVKELIKENSNQENNLRIIITGHSLGSVLAELFGYYLKKYKSKEITCPIHIITFGACCVFDAAGRNEFNSQLNISGSNVFTLDRITANGDPVVLLPAHLDHGGYTLLKSSINELKAFTKTGRTNEIGEIRKMLGLEQGESKENYDGNELLISKAFIELFKNSDHFIKNGTYDFNLYKKKYKNLTPNFLKNKNKKLKIKQEAMPNLKQTAGEQKQEPQSTEFRKNTKKYKQETLNKMPNQINYSCYKTISKGFCHGVYMGVSYMNVLRLIGDKEPVKDYILYKTENGKIFSLPKDGISFEQSNCIKKAPLMNRIKTKFGDKKINQNQPILNSEQPENPESTSSQNTQSGFSCSIL